MKWFPTLALLLMACVLSNTGHADVIRIKDARFDARIALTEQPLHLRGAGLYTYGVFIDVYAAALYLPLQATQTRVLEPDVAKRLEIVYFVDITREQFAQAAMKTLAQQLSDTEMLKLRKRIDQLHGLYRNVNKGDRYALTYRPNQGTTLELNGNVLGTVHGADFASAYFSIWLSKQPIAPALKDTLLKPRG